jgi:hypothetical protein
VEESQGSVPHVDRVVVSKVGAVFSGVVANERPPQVQACTEHNVLRLVRVAVQKHALRHRKIDAGIEQVLNSKSFVGQSVDVNLGQANAGPESPGEKASSQT